MSAGRLPIRDTAARAGQASIHGEETDIILQESGGQTEPTPTPEAVAVLHKKWSALSTVRRQEILRALPANVMTNYAQAIEDLVVDKLKDRRTLRIAARMAPLVEFVNILGTVASALDSTVPGASAALSVIKSIFAASQTLADLQEYLVELIVFKVSSNLRRVSEYRELFQSSPELLSDALDIYGVVLEIGGRAAKFFYDDKGNKRNGLRVFASTFWSGCQKDLKALAEKLSVRVDNFRATADLLLAEMTTSGLQTLAANHNRQETQLRQLKAGLDQQTRLLLDNRTPDSSGHTAIQAEHRRELLRWIGEQTARLDCATIHDKLQRVAVEGTGQWLIHHPTFESWIEGRGSNLLWISGNWGTGKSVLASSVVDLLLERSRIEDATACAYIYCSSENHFFSSSAVTDATAGRAIGYKAILGSILHQLYGTLPNDRDVDRMVLLWRQGASILERHLEQAIKDVIAMLTQSFIVIDGLDELQRVNDVEFVALCKFIGSLKTSALGNTGLKVLVLSRPDYPDIASAMQGSAAIRIDANANHDDIWAFVGKEVASLGRMGRYEQQMKDDLVGRARGVFRWVSAVVSYVRHMKSPSARAKAVKDMPPGLKDVYAKILERILQQGDIDFNYAAIALLWVAHAFRPLSTDEMAEALSIEPGMEAIDEDDRIDPGHIDELCENCQGLLELNDGFYQLPHDSVRDFLLGDPDPNHGGLVEFWNLRAHAHEKLAEACLTYLNLDVFDMDREMASSRRVLEQLRQDYPLLQYASHHWGDHLRQVADEYPTPLDQLVQTFLLSTNRREITVQILQDEARVERFVQPGSEYHFSHSDYTVPLHLVTLFGLERLLPVYGQDQAAFAQKDGFGFLPIDYAVLRDKKSGFDWILAQTVPGSEVVDSMERDAFFSLTHYAATCDWTDSLQRLLTLGFAYDAPCAGTTALHRAAAGGSLRALQVLLNAGADINAVDAEGDTALLLAASQRDSELCKILLEHGADINAKRGNGTTVLHLFAKYHQNLVQELVRREVVFGVTTDGLTPLHVATANGHVEIVRTLCHYLDREGGNRLRSELDHLYISHHNPIQMAAEAGHVEVVKVLAEEFGEDPQQVTQKLKRNLLHLAANSGEEQFVPFIAERTDIDPDAQDENGTTALHIAASLGHISFARRLLATYPTLNTRLQDNWGQVPLHNAATYGRVEMVALLLNHGFDIPDAQGYLPFHRAVEKGHLDCVRLLLRDGILEETNSIGQTPLHIAAKSGKENVAKYILSLEPTKDVRDALGNTPLHLAAASGQANIVSDLLSAGFDVLCQDNHGVTPLMMALYKAPGTAPQLVGRHGEALKLRSAGGLTCVQLAAMRGTPELWMSLWPDGCEDDPFSSPQGPHLVSFAASAGNSLMVSFFAGLGVAVDDANDFGVTLLMDAAYNGFGTVVNRLLEHGASVHRRDLLGRSPLHYATIGGFPQVVRELLTGNSGATEKDNLGMSVADYAKCCATLSLILARPNQKSPSENLCDLLESLRAFTEDAARKLSWDQKGDETSSLPNWHLIRLRRAMVHALCKLGQLGDAKLVLTEHRLQSNSDWQCDICESGFSGLQKKMFHCLECPDVDLCEACHEEYTRGTPHGKPDSRGKLEYLELESKFVGQSLYQSTRLDAQAIARLLRSDPIFRDWVELKLAEYQWTADTWPKSGGVNPDRFTGWQLVKLLKRILSCSSEGDKHFSAVTSGLTSELHNPDLRAGLQREVKEFGCCGHRYMEIRPIEDLPDDEKRCFAGDNRLSPSFYALLAERFTPQGESFQKLVAEQEKACSEAGSVDGETASVQRDLVQGDDNHEAHEISPGTETSGREPRTDFDHRAMNAKRWLKLLTCCDNPFPNEPQWRRPFCDRDTLTLRDAMWQVAKAIVAVHEDPKSFIRKNGWSSKLREMSTSRLMSMNEI